MNLQKLNEELDRINEKIHTYKLYKNYDEGKYDFMIVDQGIVVLNDQQLGIIPKNDSYTELLNLLGKEDRLRDYELIMDEATVLYQDNRRFF